MNHDAIALAADSAGTVTEHKIFNTVNKLFAFSKHRPVGVLIYGSSAINHVPWEPLIKTARSRLGRKGFDDIVHYADYFFDFVKKSAFFPEVVQKRQVNAIVGMVYQRLFMEYEDEVERILDDYKKIKISEAKNVFKAKVEKYFIESERTELLSGVSTYDEEQVRLKYTDLILEMIDALFGKFGQPKNIKNKLLEIAFAALTRSPRYTPSGSGIVFAGYGESKIFPGFCEYEVKGFYANHLAYGLKDRSEIDHDTTAHIAPFAQGDMISLFMEGIDSKYQRLINSSTESLLIKYPKILADLLCDNCSKPERDLLLDKLIEAGNKIASEFKERMSQYRQEQCIDPILDTVRHLPKDELASMAESLVNLTSLKRKVSMGAETVGGPIDVAVISKGDGFVWIKRKHYFRPDINHAFFQGYYSLQEACTDEKQ
jgi:hypothetical protein